MIENRVLPDLRAALREESIDDRDRTFATSLLQAAELYVIHRDSGIFDIPLTEREQRAARLGVRLSAYFRQFPVENRIIDVVPVSSENINNEEWRHFLSTFIDRERNTVSRALNSLVKFSLSQAHSMKLKDELGEKMNKDPYKNPLQTIGDVEQFNFQANKVHGIGRSAIFLIRNAFGRPLDSPSDQ